MIMNKKTKGVIGEIGIRYRENRRGTGIERKSRGKARKKTERDK